MNRRRFLAVSALAGITRGPVTRALLADDRESFPRRGRLAIPLLNKLLTTPQIGFPTLTPTFAAMFGPGTGGIQMVISETFVDFMAQAQTENTNGYVLSAMTSIQNLNRTWFYGAFKKGTGKYEMVRTNSSKTFQQMFTTLQSTYTLVDFNVAWELGQIYYSGYWLANAAGAKAAGQVLILDVDYDTLTSSGSGMVMTRVQAFAQNQNTMYAALFAPGNDGYAFWDVPADQFPSSVTGQFSGGSLVALAFEPTDGYLLGAWRSQVKPSQFVFNQDWNTLTATAQKAATSGMVLTSMVAYPNAPDFDDYYVTNEAPFVEGYAYAASLNGNIIAGGGGFARSAYQPNNPSLPFTADTRINLASISKVVTGVALEILLLQNPSITLDTPFWPLIKSMVPNPDPSIKTVTLRDLATENSGLVPDGGPLAPAAGQDIWAFLNAYLAQPLAGTPGVTNNYDNTNFTILQGVIDVVSGMDYVAYCNKYVLEPAGIDTSIFNATPDASTIATLEYAGPTDKTLGQYSGAIPFVAPAGWISSARELIKLSIALRGTGVLPSNVVNEMLNDGIGWDGSIQGIFGTYYVKDGGFGNGTQNLSTVILRLTEGYDAVLLTNTLAPVDCGSLVMGAFESRGVPLASEPAGGPSLTTVVHGASFLPNCAPGSYLSIIGSGFPGPAVAWDPTSTLPTELNGVEVRVGSEYAYVCYAGPTQINFLLPSTVPAGIQNVELTMPAGGMQSSVEINAIAPGLFAYTLNGRSYPAALFAGTSVVVAAAGALSGSTSRPATAGDNIELYGTGMGTTNPAAPDGVVFSKAYPATSLAAFKVTIGGKAATLSFAGLVGPGLFQLDVQIPSGLNGGDQPVTLSVGGIAAQSNLMLTIAG